MYICSKVSLTQRLIKCEADPKWYHSWPLDASTEGKGVGELDGGRGAWVHLTRGHSDSKADQMSS